MKTFRWKVKPGMDVASVPSVRKVRFGDGYSQIVERQACKLGVIMVIAVSCVKLLSAHNSTQHTSRKHKV